MFSSESWMLLLQLGYVNVLQLLIKKENFFQQVKFCNLGHQFHGLKNETGSEYGTQ
jgi:hypothetical protein